MASIATEPNADPGGGIVAVEGDLGKECHALGVLFQQIVNELKVGFRTVDLISWNIDLTYGSVAACCNIITGFRQCCRLTLLLSEL